MKTIKEGDDVVCISNREDPHFTVGKFYRVFSGGHLINDENIPVISNAKFSKVDWEILNAFK